MNWTPQLTRDGSFTFFSTDFGEAFHSSQGAKSEALAKFARVTDLARRSMRPTLRLLDVFFVLKKRAHYQSSVLKDTLNWTTFLIIGAR